MARRSFYVIDIVEILVHWHAGRSQHELAASLNVDRKTIRKYVAPAIAAGLAPGGPARSQGEWARLVRGWFPELVDTRLRQVTWPTIEVHRDYVAGQLAAVPGSTPAWPKKGLAGFVTKLPALLKLVSNAVTVCRLNTL